MRKKFLFLAALLFLARAVFAANIPDVEDPKDGPAVWLMPVYNNSGGTLDVGDVVVWDTDASTGDNDNYVNTTTTADTYIVAGVIYPADITAGNSGTIAIRGVVQVDVVSAEQLGVVNGPACTSGTAGAARSCTTNAAMFGHVTQVNSGTSALVYVEN